MCLSLPGRLVEISGSMGRVSIGNNMTEVCLDLIADPEIGDYLLVHTGFAIEKLSVEEAESTIALINELDDFAETGVN